MKEKLYLDTSVISAYYDQRAKERMEATQHFWHTILPTYQPHISEITLEEINNTKEVTLKNNLLKLVKNFPALPLNQRIHTIANAYVSEGIFPEKYIEDALHVAVASYNRIPYLISWNFEHLVKVKTRKLVNLVNLLNGYNEIEIIPPQEL